MFMKERYKQKNCGERRKNEEKEERKNEEKEKEERFSRSEWEWSLSF